MTQLEYAEMIEDFLVRCDSVRLAAYASSGYEWMVVPKTGANRTIKEQHGLFIQATDGIDNDRDGLIDEPDERVTRADGGQSPHNFGLARDIVPLIHPGVIWWNAPASYWKNMGRIAEDQGLTWGGNFKSIYDAPHVEAKLWKRVQLAWKNGDINVG
jgi:hypothetical protein